MFLKHFWGQNVLKYRREVQSKQPEAKQTQRLEQPYTEQHCARVLQYLGTTISHNFDNKCIVMNTHTLKLGFLTLKPHKKHPDFLYYIL